MFSPVFKGFLNSGSPSKEILLIIHKYLSLNDHGVIKTNNTYVGTIDDIKLLYESLKSLTALRL